MEILQSFESSSIAWAAYDQKTSGLYVRFMDNDAQYAYEKVSTREWKEFKNAESKGQYINFHIKPFHKVRIVQ